MYKGDACRAVGRLARRRLSSVSLALPWRHPPRDETGQK
jgi:hypothetical protein